MPPQQRFGFDLVTMATKKYSTAIRITTGLLGLGGVAAIGFNALQEGSIRSDAVSLFMLFAKLFAAYIFFYVAFFGTSPLAFLNMDDDDQ